MFWLQPARIRRQARGMKQNKLGPCAHVFSASGRNADRERRKVALPVNTNLTSICQSCSIRLEKNAFRLIIFLCEKSARSELKAYHLIRSSLARPLCVFVPSETALQTKSFQFDQFVGHIRHISLVRVAFCRVGQALLFTDVPTDVVA